MRDRAGLVDLSAFAIFDVTGPGGLRGPRAAVRQQGRRGAGRTVYTPLLNPAGGILADLTIMRLAHDRFRVVTGGGMGMRDRKIFAGRAAGRRLGPAPRPDERRARRSGCGGRGRATSSARRPTAATTSATRASRSSTSKTVDIDGVRTLASRISYVGELGWEIYVPIEQGRRVWDALWRGGPAARPRRRSGSARTPSRRGSRRAIAPTARSWSSTSTSSRRGWPGRRSRTPTSSAGRPTSGSGRPTGRRPVHADRSTTRRRRAASSATCSAASRS